MANLSNINNKFLVTTGGNVGIGTTSPNVLLDVWGATPTIRAVGTSASNPSLTLTSVGITAWSQTVSGSDSSLSFNKDGSEKMRIDTSGNVGIGTASPDSKLQIMNNDGSSYRFGYGGSSDVYLDADNVYIRTDNGGANTATFTTTGLGIGTTSPQSTLHVDGDIRRELDGTSTIGFGSGSTSAWYSGIKTVDFGAQNVGLTLFTTTNAGTTNVDALTIDEDGNVGIGTTSPDARLMVKDSSDSGFDSGIAIVRSASSQTGYINMVGGAMNFNSPAIPFTFRQSGSEKMRLTSTGDLLVGTTTSFALATHDPNVITNQSFGVSDGTNNSTIGLDRIHFDSSNYFVLNGSAIGVKLVNGATAWAAQSDESLKENIKPLENVLDKIKDYRCVEYNLKAEKTDKKIGFIAQDWEQDFDAIVDKDADGILSMKYTETIPVLLKAIQELSAKLEALECQCEKK